MLYYSTNKNSSQVNFRDATLKGQPGDRGLYFPAEIPVLPEAFIKAIDKYSREEIAFEVMRPYVGDSIPADVLMQIVTETVAFDIPLVKVDDDAYALELFHGPTLAFKDVGAGFMSRCLEYFVRNNDRRLLVLTATSGDTGGAVANGFYKKEGIDVVILYPSGKVSSIQELQLTRLGHNIHALEVNGSFDDCQRLVKQAFADAALNRQLTLTSANSINIARWLPQQFYYFFAWQQWPHKDSPLVISVPSGNFGNLCAGLLAYKSGLPVTTFIAACNANDTVPQYFSSGAYQPKTSIATISNAMDVGDPSNFIRILELFRHDHGELSRMVRSYSISDDETRDVIWQVFSASNYLLDPHGAVAYASLKKYKAKGIFLETAHPLKFQEVEEPLVDQPIPLPPAIEILLHQPKKSLQINAAYDELKAYLLQSA